MFTWIWVGDGDVHRSCVDGESGQIRNEERVEGRQVFHLEHGLGRGCRRSRCCGRRLCGWLCCCCSCWWLWWWWWWWSGWKNTCTLHTYRSYVYVLTLVPLHDVQLTAIRVADSLTDLAVGSSVDERVCACAAVSSVEVRVAVAVVETRVDRARRKTNSSTCKNIMYGHIPSTRQL